MLCQMRSGLITTGHLPEPDHAAAGDGGVRRMIEIRHLEHDAHVARDGQPLPVGQREQLVHVQHAVQVLHPLRVHVPVKDDPLTLVQLPAHIVNNLAQDVREQSVRPLPGVRVGKNLVFF